MAEKEMEAMAEQTGKKLSASTLKKCFWNWFFWNGCS